MKIFTPFSLFILLIMVSQYAHSQKQALLIGTFHFNNPGHDLVKTKTFDVLSTAAQKELEDITGQISKFHPDKIFVEWDHNDQKRLDSLYQLYLNGTYNNFVETTYKGKKNYGFYSQNEIFQLAFRAAKKAGLKSVSAIDYEMGLPFDTVMTVINKAGQKNLNDGINNAIAAMGKDNDEKMTRMNLTQLLEDVNTPMSRQQNNGLYIKYLNLAGKTDNFAGADLVATWYKRNLYMYSLVQKSIVPKDERIMILLGSGHTSMIKKFIDDEDVFKVVELKDVMAR